MVHNLLLLIIVKPNTLDGWYCCLCCFIGFGRVRDTWLFGGEFMCLWQKTGTALAVVARAVWVSVHWPPATASWVRGPW